MRTTKQYDELVKMYREAAVFFASHMPARIDGQLAMQTTCFDLRKLCEVVDPIVEATAEYVQKESGFTIDGAFKREQLLGAIDGNLLYEIEQAATQSEGGR